MNKIALIDRFHKIETDGELIFQLFYLKRNRMCEFPHFCILQ